MSCVFKTTLAPCSWFYLITQHRISICLYNFLLDYKLPKSRTSVFMFICSMWHGTWNILLSTCWLDRLITWHLRNVSIRRVGELNVRVWVWIWHLYFICKLLNLETFTVYKGWSRSTDLMASFSLILLCLNIHDSDSITRFIYFYFFVCGFFWGRVSLVPG